MENRNIIIILVVIIAILAIVAGFIFSLDVNYEKLGQNRQVELDNIVEEANIVKEYKTAFDEGLALTSSGAAEQALIDAENCW